MNVEHLIRIIEEIAPPHLAESWDNSGIQLYSGRKDIHSALICLEITAEVVEEAKKKKAEMIISHHPLLFNPPKSIDVRDPIGYYVTELIKADIAVYSAHLSFDHAPAGNNYYLAKLLGLSNIRMSMNNPENIPGVIGELVGPHSLQALCQQVEEALQIPKTSLRIVGDLKQEVNKVGICTGAGGAYLTVALRENCDLFITGE
ncbi:MAG: Nif3-like dinuclear metal center hexameric protein, partial [Anaerovoracaceae bacterium]